MTYAIPILCKAQFSDPDKLFLKFSAAPPRDVLDNLRRIGFGFRRVGQEGVWMGNQEWWKYLKPVLRRNQLLINDHAHDVLPVRTKCRERKAMVAKEAQERVDAAPALAEFDWSGFPTWAAENLTIKDKQTGRFVRFTLNSMQVRLFNSMWAQWQATGRVRFNILKHRQPGFSTLIQGLAFYLGLHVPGVEAIVTAHRDDSADAVFRRTKLFEQRCPERLATERNNRKEIQWKPPHGSALRVGVAGDEGFGRSDTRHVYHASEEAHYSERGVEAASNVRASVPDAPGTFVWRETTAKGLNHFYDSWNRATVEGYENFFVGFLEDETCRLDVTLDDAQWSKIPFEWKEDEKRLRAVARELGLVETATAQALAWRRRAIGERCHGLPALFLQEFPAVAEDSFVSTGSHVFPLSIVDPEWKRTKTEEEQQPISRYVIERADEKESGRLIRDYHGPLHIWREPESGVPYIVSGDVGRGVNVKGEVGDQTTLDFTTFRVFRRWPDDDGRYEEVACWHGRMDPDMAAGQMEWLGRRYNMALLVPEANHYGLILIRFLLAKYLYPRVFRREKIDKATRTPVQQALEAHWMEYGWFTGPGGGVTKAGMIENLHRLVRDRQILIHDPDAWGEMRTFVRAADGSMDAESGKHDDIVMAQAIAACILTLHPETKPIIKPVVKAIEADPETGEVAINFDVLRSQAKAKKAAQRRIEDFT